ncbi:hypothetical protein PHYBOEH_002770 [Phytophthora boehmeriae]|uniref:Peroxisomal membrane protein PEX16 n=1 Tax=Phytophthora boehmeriae TaxID=109152 RepID=A0A8T1WRP9_9STRA|nr:hypothetical protein PHYBOEH_002770 [Phytophthora boehmeriae]
MTDEWKVTTQQETDVAEDGPTTTRTSTRTTTITTKSVSPAPERPEPTAEPSSSLITRATALIATYDAWVEKNTGLARNVETTLYVAPQLVPKRVMEPEVATQLGYSLVGLLHLYHDYVLYKKTAAGQEPQTAMRRMTQLVRVPLSLISHMQVLAEVVARKVGGDVGKWRLIVWVEVLKSVLRLLLLAQQRRAMLLQGGKHKGVESAPRTSPFFRFKKAKQPGARTGKTFGKATASEPAPSVQKSTEDDANKISFESATIEAAENAREDFLMAGEICHILRPVVYAVLRRRRPETSWGPVVASLLVDLSGLALSAAAVKPVLPKTPDKTKDELSARKMALLLYLLRDPVFATVTKPATGKIADVLDHVPGVGKLFRFGTTAVMDYYHQFHFYTSAS